MPTMDFEAYVPSTAPAAERKAALEAVLANEDAAGIEYAVVMPNPVQNPDNRALAETLQGERRAIFCCQVNPNHGDAALADIETSVTQHGARMLKIMPGPLSPGPERSPRGRPHGQGTGTRHYRQHSLRWRPQPSFANRRAVPAVPGGDGDHGSHGVP